MDATIRLDFLITRPLTVHSSIGDGVAVNFTRISISSPFVVLYIFSVSGVILGGVSITETNLTNGIGFCHKLLSQIIFGDS